MHCPFLVFDDLLSSDEFEHVQELKSSSLSDTEPHLTSSVKQFVEETGTTHPH